MIVLGCVCLLVLYWAESKLLTRNIIKLLKRFGDVFLRSLLIGVSLWILLLPNTRRKFLII